RAGRRLDHGVGAAVEQDGRRGGVAERHDAERQQGRADGDHRRQEVEDLIDLAGDDLFLEDELQAVEDRLDEAERYLELAAGGVGAPVAAPDRGPRPWL